MVAVGGNVMQQPASAPSPAPLVFMIFSGPPMTAQCANIHAADSGNPCGAWRAKLILVEFRYSARQQRMLGLRFASSSVKPAIYKPIGPAVTAPDLPSPAPCQMPTTDRFLGQRFGFIFVHRKDRNVVFEDCCHHCGFSAMTNLVPSVSTPVRYISSRTQWLSWLLPAWVTRFATHQIRGENQCRGSGNPSSGMLSARSWFMWPGLIAKYVPRTRQSA